MKTPVEHLFSRMKCADETVQSDAVAQFWMLLEQSNYPERRDDMWRSVLPDDLFGVCLLPEEIKEIVNSAIELAESKRLYRSTEQSLIGIIVRFADIEKAETVFRFFSEQVEPYDEQVAFSLLAGLTQFCRRNGGYRKVGPFIEKFNTIRLLKGFQNGDSKRLREAATRMLKCLSSEAQM